MNSDPIIERLDQKIDEIEAKLEEIREQTVPYKKELDLLSDVRRRLTGLTQSPTREQNKEKTAREVALEEEVFRLRAELAEKESFKY